MRVRYVTLRAYQTEFNANVEAAFAGGARAVLGVLPTGGGKTVCFADLTARWQAKRRRVLVVAHRRELIRQASAKLTGIGLAHGVIAPGFPARAGADVQVGSVQTLTRREIGLFDALVFDEAHHAVAGGWAKLREAQPSALIFGVTATPERLDGRGLGGVFDTLIQGPSIPFLVDAGFLSPIRVFGPPAAPDLRAVRTLAGDWSAEELAAIMDAPSVTGDAAEHYYWHTPGQPAIAFCTSVAHAQHTAAQFNAEGWRALAVNGSTPVRERDAAIARLATGEVEILATCDLISEGLDVPAVSVVILLRPTKSLGLYLQQVGRGMRPAPGKSHLTVLDHAGNTLRHGMADAAREWSLTSGKRANTAPAIRQCSHCYAIHAPAPRCPCCGHADIATRAAGRAANENADGSLTEITAEDPRIVRLRSAPLRELVKKANGYSALLEIEQARGYAAGWAQNMLERKAALHRQYRRAG